MVVTPLAKITVYVDFNITAQFDVIRCADVSLNCNPSSFSDLVGRSVFDVSGYAPIVIRCITRDRTKNKVLVASMPISEFCKCYVATSQWPCETLGWL